MVALLFPVMVSDREKLSSLCALEEMTYPLFPVYKSLAGGAPGKKLLGKGDNCHAGAVQLVLMAQGWYLIQQSIKDIGV